MLPPVLELLLDSPEGTVLSLNVPDLPVDDLGSLPARRAWPAAAPCRRASTRSATATCCLGEVEVSESEPEEGTDSTLWSPGTRR